MLYVQCSMENSLKEKISNDLKESLKSGDNFKRDVLRLLSGAFKNVEIEKMKKEEQKNIQENQVTKTVEKPHEDEHKSTSAPLANEIHKTKTDI